MTSLRPPNPWLARIILWSLVLLASTTLPGKAGAAGGTADHVGSGRCSACHADQGALWHGSHHDLAMAEAGEDTVLGDFDDAEITVHGVTTRFYRSADGGYRVHTDGPDGTPGEYPVTHTFGWSPLQQYLVPFPGGRLQALGVAWDARPAARGGQRWFHLYPGDRIAAGDRLHWTGYEQTWNHQCAECHSTALRKGYDPASDGYQTTWSEIDVACEACHGPGRKHVAWAEASVAERAADPTRGLEVALARAGQWRREPGANVAHNTAPGARDHQVETCARCHSRRGLVWGEYAHGQPLGDTHRLAFLDDPLYFVDGQIRDEVYVFGSFAQSRMHAAGVVCSDCHEPHSLELRAEGNALCTRCHAAEQYDASRHHHHADGSDGAACTACHMPQRTYMVIDERADHSLRIPRPDLSARLGTPDPCSACHTDRDARWAARQIDDWTGSAPRPAHFATAFNAARSGAPGADAALLAIASDASKPGIVRASAIGRLRDPASPAVGAARASLRIDPDPLVREAVVRSLSRVPLQARIETAWAALGDPVRTVRLAAVRALAPALRGEVPTHVQRRIGDAVQEYLQSAQTGADRPETHLDLGSLATDLGRPAAAEAALRKALELDPAFAPAYVNLADLQRALGREDEALTTLRTGIEVAGDSATLRHSLGLALVRAGRLQDALVPLTEAARLDPDSARFALVLGVARREAGDGRGAIAALEAGLRRSAYNRDLLQALATTHAAAGDLDEAGEVERRLRDIQQREAAANR